MTELALGVRKVRPGVKVIADMRGLEHAELQFEGHSPADIEKAIGRETKCVTQADHVFCVSQTLLETFSELCEVDGAKHSVVPTCVDAARFDVSNERREAVRSELGVSNRLVVVFCGSNRRYQMPEQTIELFRIVKSLNRNAFLLVLTSGVEAMSRLMERGGWERGDYEVRSVPSEKVAEFMSAGDVGVLLREQLALNAVAAPVKYGEYLAAGLPVIMNDAVHDYAKLTRERDVGLVLNAQEPLGGQVHEIRQFLDRFMHTPRDWRIRCKRVAMECLDAHVYVDRVLPVYRTMAG